MSHFLIIGAPADLHAGYVAWALEQAGYEARFINSSQESSPTRTTLYLDGEVDEFRSEDWTNAEAVWCSQLPYLPSSSVNLGENDGFTRAEQCRFTRWLIDLHRDQPIRWINHPSASASAENRFLQLKRAREHGLAVPRTLVTANPERFRAFLESEGSVVAEPLCGHDRARDSGAALSTFANVIAAGNGATLADADIARCPTVYQQRIDKVADVRMLILGQDLLAYKIVQEGEHYLDYRIGFTQAEHLRFQPLSIRTSLKARVNGFVESLGIDFATADFAITREEEFVFLDLNPKGQWLPLEREYPADRAGAKFCSFFVKGGLDARLEARFPSFAEFQESDRGKAMDAAVHLQVDAQGPPATHWGERWA